MRARFSSIVVVCALAGALGSACSGGGSGGGGGGAPGDGGGGGTTASAFPQGFLPVRLGSGTVGRGDVAFRSGGDLYIVDGSADVTAVSRANGAVTTFANDVDGGNAVLRSIVVGSDGRVFTGDNTGKIWVIPAAGGSSALLLDTATGTAITGLAVAPSGFGSLGGSLIAAAGTQGIVSVTTSAGPAATVLVPSGNRYVDVAFSGTTLFALDATSDEIDTVTATGTVASFQAGFGNPMGMAVDDGRAEILVADAGPDVLRVVPLAGGTPTDRAPYDFDASAPSGIAYDGSGAIAFVTKGSVVVRGSAVPRIDAASPNFGPALAGPTVGYGDLELDRDGLFVLVANDTVDPPGNFLFRVSRDGATTTTLASNIGAAGEQLLSLAIDPATQAIYIGTDLGNVFRRSSDGTVSLLVSASANAVLGLEFAPATGFGSFGGHLIATTSAGEIFAIDPLSPNPPAPITPSQALKSLNDLVFSSSGTLYALENDGSATPRLLSIAADGTVTHLSTPGGQLGRPDGIEIDEGGKRLLVASYFPSGDKLLAIALSNTNVTQLVAIDLDFGINPTGVVYDRLGTAIVRGGGETTTTLDAVSVFP
jgi:sugar lactone lactonase YvrE